MLFFLPKCLITGVDISPGNWRLSVLVVLNQILVSHLEHLVHKSIDLGCNLAAANQDVCCIKA